jgi:hypothetical protein
MNAVTTFDDRKTVPALPAADLEIAKDFARSSKAAATRCVYQKDFARFTAWCDQRRIPPIPAAPETVAAFLAAEAARGIKPATIGRTSHPCGWPRHAVNRGTHRCTSSQKT